MEDRFTPHKASGFVGTPGFSPHKVSRLSGDPRSARILIAGLGLIGGSAAKALKAAGYNELYAYDSDLNALNNATAEGVILQGFSDIGGLPVFRLMICCLPPAAAAEFCRDAQSRLEDGGVFAEMGGIKSGVISGMASALQGKCELLSLHTMAGRETSGYANSDAGLFSGSVLIFTPTKKTGVNALLWASILQNVFGCSDIRELTAKRHDEVIARVSHLPHILALAIKAMEGDEALQPFAGGSYKSATRVAGLGPALWAELFAGNKENILESISLFKAALCSFERALDRNDISELEKLLSEISGQGE
jgi:prephenate dehydrogenase